MSNGYGIEKYNIQTMCYLHTFFVCGSENNFVTKILFNSINN